MMMTAPERRLEINCSTNFSSDFIDGCILLVF